MSEAFVDPYASARILLEDGTVLSGTEGLQVWMSRRELRELREAPE